MRIIIKKSSRTGKKFQATVGERTVHFGARAYTDFTQGASLEQKEAYLARHRKREDWGRSGIATAGFYARWVLWNRRSVSASVADLNSKFSGITFSLE